MARLFSWLLNAVYLAALAMCVPLIAWQSLRTGKYRAGFREKFFGLVPRRESSRPCIWVHAVSVGEVNLMAALVRELRAAHAGWEIVVSTTSRAGYELACKKYADLTVFYCPLDFSWSVRTAMRRVRPALLMLAELELWPNLITAAKERGARVAVVNGRLSDRSFPRYRRINVLIRHLLQQIDLIAAQDEETATRFRILGAPAERVHMTGSLKYDGAETDRNNCRTISLRRLAGFTVDDVVFLAGSTQEPEEQIAVDVFRRLVVQHPRLRLVLVPRHPERFDDVARLLDASKLPWCRRTQLVAQPPAESGADRPASCSASDRLTVRKSPAPPAFDPWRILLVDTVGELGAWWGTADIAFVGGSFGNRGGQNMIEPAAYGAAVSFGPNTWNFRDIVAALASAGGAVVVQDAAALESFVRRCLDEPHFAAALGERAQSLVRSQLGATRRTLELVESLVRQPLARQRCQQEAA